MEQNRSWRMQYVWMKHIWLWLNNWMTGKSFLKLSCEVLIAYFLSSACMKYWSRLMYGILVLFICICIYQSVILKVCSYLLLNKLWYKLLFKFNSKITALFQSVLFSHAWLSFPLFQNYKYQLNTRVIWRVRRTTFIQL
jgi:hypothetical protein